MASSKEKFKNPIFTPEEAVEQLRHGDVVALPTETVYGLAASIYNTHALRKIFETKKRPFFDPLIVHVLSKASAKKLVKNWTPSADKLAEAFWPGPLTLVLPKADAIHPIITSGLETVALRSPRHPVFLNILSQLGEPLAAPSANRFGKTSPTQVQHVLDEFQTQIPVVDGGECDVGIESTIVSLEDCTEASSFDADLTGADLCESKVTLLRPGIISMDEIKKILGPHYIYEQKLSGEKIPGHIEHHYQPDQPIVVGPSSELIYKDQLLEKVKRALSVKFQKISVFTLSSEPEIVARTLYSQFRELSKDKHNFIYIPWDEAHNKEEWSAIKNRVFRAATLVL